MWLIKSFQIINFLPLNFKQTPMNHQQEIADILSNHDQAHQSQKQVEFELSQSQHFTQGGTVIPRNAEGKTMVNVLSS